MDMDEDHMCVCVCVCVSLQPALEKIASQYESLKSSALSELLTSHITQAEKDSGSKGGAEGGDAEPLTAPQKLALAAAYIQVGTLATHATHRTGPCCTLCHAFCALSA